MVKNEERIRQIIVEIEDISVAISDLEDKIAERCHIYDQISNGRPIETIKPLYERKKNDLSLLNAQISQLNGRKFALAKELISLEPLVKTNGVIDLKFTRKFDNSGINGNYAIVLCNSGEVVGRIDYRGYHSSYYLGDVGYLINPEHRGHNYAYQALCLLGEHLKENGIDNFWICTTINNKASMRIITKYGGTIISEHDGCICYSANTRVRNGNDKTSRAS